MRWRGSSARAYNLGNGSGYSNREVIHAVQEVTGRAVCRGNAARRPGDPARLVADAASVRRELSWQPAFPDLRTMVETAWQWRLKHPEGTQQ